MKFACPNCGHACGIFKGECPGCGLSLSLGSLLKFYARILGEKLRGATALRCPHCHFANPLQSNWCRRCGIELSVRLATATVLEKPRRNWQNILNKITPGMKRAMQWCYLIFSAASLWWLLAFVEERGGESWPIYMALSIIYVAVIAFLALWLIPRRIFINISRRAAALVKLSLALNGLSATLLIQLFIKGWWVRALTLSGLFLVIWLGAWVFHRFLLTMAAETEAAFLGGSAPFDHTARQGRSARVD